MTDDVIPQTAEGFNREKLGNRSHELSWLKNMVDLLQAPLMV